MFIFDLFVNFFEYKKVKINFINICLRYSKKILEKIKFIFLLQKCISNNIFFNLNDLIHFNFLFIIIMCDMLYEMNKF